MSTAEEDDGKDKLKVEFTLAALRRTDDPFSSTVVLHADIIAAIEWQAARSADEVMQAREKVVCEIEALGTRLWANGTVAGWYRGCDGAIASFCNCKWTSFRNTVCRCKTWRSRLY